MLTSTQLLKGAWVTVWMTVVSMALGLVLAVIVAAARSSRFIVLRGITGFYVWLMRGTPLLVQLVIIYTGLPQIGIKLGVIEAAILGLVLNEAAYLSEIVRSGLMAVPTGQTEAARALGMSPLKVFRVVVLPQALRVMIPSLGNSFNALLKTTTLLSVISVQELLRETQFAVQLNFRVLEGLVAAAIYYLALTTLWGLIQRALEKKFGRGYDRNYRRKATQGAGVGQAAELTEAVNR
ncbi:amino acid ABC transporter permease [Nocardia sp. NPDC052112]|uniref:amino acid ABC transporter permease n=1 Tax=Nocardia sp. NPDC052112 TaxID=3155646 RepID=UPI003432CBA6